jgi:aminomethyltransferase
MGRNDSWCGTATPLERVLSATETTDYNHRAPLANVFDSLPGRSRNRAMSADALLRTPLYDWHRSHGARLVDFAGWSMPVQYTSIIEEHVAVRDRVGVFDISHMGRLTFDGPDALTWIERVTTNEAARLAVEQIQYSLIANGGGGLIDDVLVYRLSHGYAVVCNAANRGAVLAEFERFRQDNLADLVDRTGDTAMIAVQGPRALETVQPLFNSNLKSVGYYHLTSGRLLESVDAIMSRTGYTGEDGFELIVSAGEAPRVWEAILASGEPHGIRPCGLGARDTLRFEAAMPLYGHELTDTIDPYSAGLGWAVKLAKGDFIGREALTALKAQRRRRRIGLRLEGKRIARQGSMVRAGGQDVGFVTSGTFSPTLGQSLAMALIETSGPVPDGPLTVDVRGTETPAEIVPLPFYQRPAAASSKE